MADAEAPPKGAKKKSSLIGTIVEWLIVTIIAGGAGAGLTLMNPQPTAEKTAVDKSQLGKLTSATKEGEKIEAAAACGAGGPSMVDLPPIVTNIATPSDTWIRLEGSIVFDPKMVPNPEVIAAEIATDELAYLHTVNVTDLQGPVGLQNIRQDLRDRAIVRSNGRVTELLLKTLVLQ